MVYLLIMTYGIRFSFAYDYSPCPASQATIKGTVVNKWYQRFFLHIKNRTRQSCYSWHFETRPCNRCPLNASVKYGNNLFKDITLTCNLPAAVYNAWRAIKYACIVNLYFLSRISFVCWFSENGSRVYYWTEYLCAILDIFCIWWDLCDADKPFHLICIYLWYGNSTATCDIFIAFVRPQKQTYISWKVCVTLTEANFIHNILKHMLTF